MVKYTNLEVGKCYKDEGNIYLGKYLSMSTRQWYGDHSFTFENKSSFEPPNADYEFTEVECGKKNVKTVTGTTRNEGDIEMKGGKRRGKKSRKQRKVKKSRKTRATRKH